jgi:prevent-host-death family protein
MEVVNVHEAKTHLSRLLERVSAGEEIVIARGGTPVARLVPLAEEPRRPGRLRGRIKVRAGFDDPLPDAILAGFRGERE